MVQLQRIAKPIELTDTLVDELTEKFKNTGETVWNKPFIKQALLRMSHNKCCYCECRLEEESKYLEVEHYFPKSIFPHIGLFWLNLFAACKRCNGNKSNHDPSVEPLIHPVLDNPKEHLSLKAYRFYAKTEKGKTTIETIGLNDRQRLVNKRYEIGSKMIDALDELEILANRIFGHPPFTIRERNKVITSLRQKMKMGLSSEIYSATISNCILTEPSYLVVKNLLNQEGLWDNDFQDLENKLTVIAFENAK
jgi:uncharacterized protein (TIGR02646 family)